MALRKRGKKGYYSAYFRTVKTLPDGTMKYSTVTVCLGTADLRTARAMEAELMIKNEAARLYQRAQAHIIRLEVAAGKRNADEEPVIVRERRRKRLKLSEVLEVAQQYRTVSEDSAKIWRRFARSVSCKYLDEVTPELALTYLQERYGSPDSGKAFNNNRSALSGVVKFCLVDAGMSSNPFAVIPVRRFVSQHQRPFSEDEFRRIYKAAVEPWKTAVLIAWHTGMREETVFNLRWSNLKGDVITALPGKTARFGRAVEVPLHPQVMARLEQLPRINDKIFGCFEFFPKSSEFKLYFGRLLDSLGIRDSAAGIVNFNCFRNSFITSCDSHNVPRHATRGVVGQIEDEITDLYSRDLKSARKIQHLPWVKLE